MKCIGDKCEAWIQHDFNQSWFKCGIDSSGCSRTKSDTAKCYIEKEVDELQKSLDWLRELQEEIKNRQ